MTTQSKALGAVAVLLLATAIVGCGNGRSDPQRPRTGSHAASDTPHPTVDPTATNDPPAAPAGETWDAEGVTVARAADGTVHVSGTDRWGVRIDTVFADATYFANAVPVLTRSLTDPQAQALAAVVPRVRAAAAAPGSAP